MLSVIHIQFLAQFPRQTKTGDEAIDRQILSNLVFAVYDLQYQFSLRLVQLFNEILVVSLDFSFELRWR